MDFLKGLNDAQLRVATHRGSPLLVFAAAGTGKTQALASRIAHLVVNDGIPPEKILALTFTRKAAMEMRERTASLCGSSDPEGHTLRDIRFKNIGTFHSLCVHLLRKYGFWKKTRLNAKFTILEPEQADALMEEMLWDEGCFEAAMEAHSLCARALPQHVRQKEIGDAIKIPVVRKRIDAWRNRGLEPDDAQVVVESESGGLVGRVASEVYTSYRTACTRRNVVDFGDLLLHACRTLERVPGALDDCRRNAYAHLLVDEFQDTNEAQMKLVRILCGGTSNHESPLLTADKLMVVGDDYQAIHQWRGSNVKNILDFTLEFPTAQIVCLSLNYRSVPSILEAARNVIANNVHQRHKALVATREEPEKRKDRGDPESQPVRVEGFDSPQDEAEKIAEEIYEGCRSERNVPSDFAILYRSNAQSQPLEQALHARGIPYKIRGGARSFFERSEIKDCMAYARLLSNPRSDADFERAIHVPSRRIGEKTMECLRSRVDDPDQPDCTCFMEAAKVESASPGCPKNRREGLEAFTALFAGRASLRDLLDSAGYLKMVREDTTISSATKETNRFENVMTFLQLAERQRSLMDFLDACALMDSSSSSPSSSLEEGEGEEHCVSLMTIHASKGLEFEVVYVAGCVEGALPHSLSVLEGNIEEERRLCYVAITRAKRRLILCVPRTRLRSGRIETSTPSRFLWEAFPE